MKSLVLILGSVLLSACAMTSNTPSKFVTENSIVKTRIQDPNMEREIEYQLATQLEFKTVSRRIGSESAKKCEEFAREYIAMPAWIEICDQALAKRDLLVQNRQATLFNRGLIHMNLGMMKAAKADFYTLLDEAPGYGDAFVSLGTIEANAQNYGAAMDYANKALASGAEQAERVYVLIGWVAEHEFDFPAARAAYETALRLKPGAAATRRKLQRVNRLWPETVASR